MMEIFDTVCASLYSKLELICDSCTGLKSCSAAKGKLWSLFHKVTLCELPDMWCELFLSLGMECDDHLLSQSTNQKLFEKVLLNHFSKASSAIESKCVDEVSLSKDELNILRYVSGFVPHSLLKRFERSEQKYGRFCECLGEMAVVSDHSDFLDYTKEWISKVNRGGLFPVNDATFLLFTEIEKQTRRLLPNHMQKKCPSNKDLRDIADKISENEDVQF